MLLSPWIGQVPPDPAGLPSQFDALTLTAPPPPTCYIDIEASSHMGSNTGIPMSNFNSRISSPKHVIVGDGFFLPTMAASHTTLLHTLYHLTNTHIAPKITKNLISVH